MKRARLLVSNPVGLLCLSFVISAVLMEKDPSKARDDKMDNKRGPAGPPPLGATD